MTIISLSLCLSCANRKDDGNTCAAFPDGIPDTILAFGGDHRESVPGDHGVIFKLDTDKQQLFDDWLEKAAVL
jgi:hypothetical protein